MPFADLANVRLHYELDGSVQNPVLVLSHSISANLTMWDAVLPALADRFRILRYDTRGHGRSSVPSGPYAIADLAGDVIGLLDALDIQRCFFCGLSLGGMTGIWLGIHASGRMAKLILANTGARIGTRELWNDRIQIATESGLSSMTKMILDRWFTRAFQQASPATIERVSEMIAGTSSQGYINCGAAIRDADFTADLPRIRTPGLIISSTHDPATPPADGRILAERMQQAKYIELDTSHLSAIEDPSAFSAAVLSFLSEPEA